MDAQVETEMVTRSSHKVLSEEVSAKAVMSSQVIKQSSITSEQMAGTAIQGAQDIVSEISALRLADSDVAKPLTNFSKDLVVGGGDNDRQQFSTASESSSSMSTVSSVVQKESGSSVVVKAEESSSSTSSQNETEVTVTMKKHKDEVLTIEDVSEEENATVVVVKNTEDNVDAVTVVEVEAAEPDASKTSTETNETEEVVVEKSDSGEVTKTTTKTVVVVDKNAALEDQSHSTTSTTKTTTVTSVITKSECNPEEKTVETEEVVVVVAADKAPLAEVEPKNAVTVEEVKKDGAKETQQVVEEEEEEEEDEEEEVVYEEEESDEEEVVEEKKTDQTKKFIVEEKELGKKELKTVDQVPQGEDAVDKPKEPSPPTESSGQPKDAVQQKKNNIQNAIKEIISDIDSDINEENIAILKKQQMELLKQQQDLAQQIRQQQQLAQQLAAENQMHQQQLQQQQKLKQQQQQQQQQQQLSKEYQLPQKNISKYSTYEESKDDAGGYTCKSETFESSESSNVSKKVDLHKIFTPATDVEEILPKNRKLYSSSAFYSPTLHPTVEDQVELARRISHSLSDTNNQKSKGQSMYVNRKKRSVKWVHEGSGQDINDTVSDIDEEGKENTEEPNEGEQLPYKKLPLRLIMNPRGQMRDIHSEQDVMNFETGLLSPDKCAEVVNDLQAKKGRGAELFAKRRRKSEKWIVDETNAGTQSPSGLPDLHQYQPRPPTSPSMVPAYSDAGKHRVQLNMHQEQLLEKYAKPDLKVVKTPWEAALETGSASAAFVEDRKPSPYQTTGPRLSPSVAPQYHDTKTMGVATQIAAPPVAPISYDTPYNQTQTMSQTQYSAGKPRSFLQRDLAYKPSVAQGWKAPSVTLPKEYLLNQQKQQQNLSEQYQMQQNHHGPSVPSSLQHMKIDETLSYLYNQQQLEQNFIQQQREQFEQEDEVQAQRQYYQQQLEQQTQKQTYNQQHLVEPHLLDHLRRSPELRTAPIPIQNLCIYDDAVNELKRDMVHRKQQQQQQPQTQTLPPNADYIREDQYERVDVRKTLEEFEKYQQQMSLERQHEEILVRQREARLKRIQLQKHQNKQMESATNEPHPHPSPSQRSVVMPSKADVIEDYVKVAVRDLITTFEKQNQQQQQPHEQQNNAMPSESFSDVDSLDNRDGDFSYQDLYVPKEIPFGSYAPPPEMNLKPITGQRLQPSADVPPQQSMSYMQSPSPATTSSAPTPTPQPYNFGFPVSKPSVGGFGGRLTPSAQSSFAPPKQQQWAPTSYQKVPQTTSQNVPPVSFNPSPLPYDKLAKFENPEPSTNNNYGSYGVPALRHLSPRGGVGSSVRNLSPTPFGRSQPCVSPKPSYDKISSPTGYAEYNNNNSSNNNYGSFSTPEQSPRASRLSHNDLIHGQTFNNSARGWKSGAPSFPISASAGHHHRPQMAHSIPITTSSLPYTDF